MHGETFYSRHIIIIIIIIQTDRIWNLHEISRLIRSASLASMRAIMNALSSE